MVTTRLELGRVNAADTAAFVGMVAPLFEGAPRFLDRLADARPFGDWGSMFTAARAIAHAMPTDEQVELIDAHPRLGAPPATVSEMSYREQGYDRDASGKAREAAGVASAGADPARPGAPGAVAPDPARPGAPGAVAPDPARPRATGAVTPAADPPEIERDRVAAELERLNVAYETRFGFRYCVRVGGRPRSALLPDMEASLEGDPETERHRALDAVVDIALDRLGAVRGPNM